MNLIIVDPTECHPDGTVTVTGDRARHIATVLRKKTGDSVRLGIADGPAGVGEIVAMTDDTVRCRFQPTDVGPTEPPVDLVVALPRPVMLRRIFTQAAPLGIARIVCIRTRRVERSYFQSPLLDSTAYRPLLRQGMAQAMVTWQPRVTIVPRFRQFVESVLPDLLAATPLPLLFHPETADTLATVVQPPLAGRVVAAVGPEGGWIAHEVETLLAHGFQSVTLGPRILRVDTAIAFIAGQLELLRHVGR